GFWTTIFIAFIAVGVVEETFKFGGLLGYPYHRPFFNEPMDGIMYSVMIGMGFATFENVLYADRFGLETALVRAFTAVPAHAVFAVILGYFVGLARFDREKRVPLLLKGYGITVVVHGIYDFFILQSLFSWLIIFAMVVLVISIYFARKMVLEHQLNSPFREEEIETLE
ncbi:MAG: PrsW family intramembrane metalloprotease, partial [Phaeodactylibacter sp.]|nr:PrsW family intramembrane metalloprotease [Phaeodactylibacter sp.]